MLAELSLEGITRNVGFQKRRKKDKWTVLLSAPPDLKI